MAKCSSPKCFAAPKGAFLVMAGHFKWNLCRKPTSRIVFSQGWKVEKKNPPLHLMNQFPWLILEFEGKTQQAFQVITSVVTTQLFLCSPRKLGKWSNLTCVYHIVFHVSCFSIGLKPPTSYCQCMIMGGLTTSEKRLFVFLLLGIQVRCSFWGSVKPGDLDGENDMSFGFFQLSRRKMFFW